MDFFKHLDKYGKNLKCPNIKGKYGSHHNTVNYMYSWLSLSRPRLSRIENLVLA